MCLDCLSLAYFNIKLPHPCALAPIQGEVCSYILTAPPIEGMETRHICLSSVTPILEKPYAAPGLGDPIRRGDHDEVPYNTPTPISREIPEPETHGHMHAELLTTPSEEEFLYDAPGEELPHAPTTRGVHDVTPCFPSSPDRLDYD